ncbi:MAG: hypothetical protein J5833_01315, partial [Victivallales bacterium]|nr:hypothetical protein [Victivallales bacterium]
MPKEERRRRVIAAAISVLRAVRCFARFGASRGLVLRAVRCFARFGASRGSVLRARSAKGAFYQAAMVSRTAGLALMGIRRSIRAG